MSQIKKLSILAETSFKLFFKIFYLITVNIEKEYLILKFLKFRPLFEIL